MVQRPWELSIGPVADDGVGVPVVGYARAADRCGRLACTLEVATQDGRPDDVDPNVGVRVSGELIVRLTGAGNTGGSYWVDQQYESGVALVGVERRLNLFDAVDLNHIGSRLTFFIGIGLVGEQIHVVVDSRDRDSNPGRVGAGIILAGHDHDSDNRSDDDRDDRGEPEAHSLSH